MQIVTVLLLYLVLIQTLQESVAAGEYHEEVEEERRKPYPLEESCGAYTHKMMKPLLEYLNEMKQKIVKNDAEMEIKIYQIRQLEQKLMKLQLENSVYKSKEDSNAAVIGELRELKNIIMCEQQSREITLLRAKVESDNQKLNEYEIRFRKQNETIIEMKKKIEKLQIEDVSSKGKTSCIAFGNSSDVHELSLSNNYNLHVLCNSEIVGSGWTVIQQRINGAESFDRNWTSYRNGFGSFDGDFFLGLENIHRLTSEQPHELYIHMERFNGSNYFARYDKFAISGENDQYSLNKLGKFSGHTSDLLNYHINSKFSTFDRINSQGSNCLTYFTGGWWYKNCAYWLVSHFEN